jgi:hypothetical protein
MKEKTGFFLFCGKQAKINALIFLFLLCFIHPVCDRIGFVNRLRGQNAVFSSSQPSVRKQYFDFYNLFA